MQHSHSDQGFHSLPQERGGVTSAAVALLCMELPVYFSLEQAGTKKCHLTSFIWAFKMSSAKSQNTE